MRAKSTSEDLPRESIRITEYGQLQFFLAKFAAGELGLVLLLGRSGIGKSESVRRIFAPNELHHETSAWSGEAVLYVDGHVQPYGLYRGLWEYRDRPIVLDDLDKLYADPNCVRLLKSLCNTTSQKRLTWLTRLTLDGETPKSFVTNSNVILLANEWRTLNGNVRALEDRAIILSFDPSNDEVHRQVGGWFKDAEVFDFIERVLPVVTAISMRHYFKASQLRRAGLPEWRRTVLQMMLADARLACVAALQHEPGIQNERERVEKFIASTGASRATYFRTKARLPNFNVQARPSR